MKYKEFWQGEDGIRNVIPRAGRKGEFPEKPGFDPMDVLPAIIKGRPVCEVGCGYGRLAGAFEDDKYIGVDPNREAVARAKRNHPAHIFHVIDGYKYPPTMAKFAYTVAMHVPDDEYPLMIEAMCESTGDQIVIAEILGSYLRKELTRKKVGVSHATYGRDQMQHENEFLKHGWSLVTYHAHPYPGKGNFTFLDFRKGI
jgi:SAM-dependent methyltransferase